MAVKKYATLNTLSSFLDNLKNLFATKTEMSAKANKSHSHSISDIDNLQTALDTKTNQNAFSNVKIDNTTISADIITDTLTLVAGNNITITPDVTNDKITISSIDTNTTYSAGTGISLSGTTFSNSGVHSVSTGSSNGTISVNTNGTTTNVAVKGLGSAAYTASTAYDAAGAANNALASAKTYADNAANAVKNDLLNGAGEAYNTLKELGDLIDDNTDAIDALEVVAAGKADKSHTHSIANVSGLQTALDGKAASSHGTHVLYSTTAPVMDGTASVGSASTIARSDHKHPTDTSRAAQTSLDSHTSNTTVHMNATERTNWNAAKTHADSAHAPSNAEKNQNAFSNVKVGTTTVAADTATDTITFEGSNVTITPDATNDKITFAVANGTTSTKGIVQLTNSTSSTSTTTAATPSSVKAAYDLANTAKTTADGKANASHTHTVANITDLTATAKELNYMDGVTSNVQTQLDGKSASGHTHNYAGSSSVGGAATSANKLNTDAGSATQPVYFANGIPVKTTYTLGKSVPSDAKFTDTTYSAATTSANGLMSSTDKKKVDSISGSYSLGSFASKTVKDLQTALDTWLNSYVSIANASANFQASQDWVTAWNSGNTATTISAGGTWTVTNIAPYSTKAYAQLRISYYSDEWIVYVHRSNGTWGTAHQAAFKDDLDSKQNTVTGGASTITGSNLTANRALISNGSGKVAVSAVTSTELGYLDGVTSNIQTQIDGKANSSHTHNYAGSSSAGGSANSAVKLQTARSIGLGNDFTGSANFDGSGNITISAKHYNVSCNSSNKSNYPYHRIAYKGSKASPITSQYNDTDAVFLIRESYNTGCYGILKVSLRTNASTSTSQASATWLVRYNISLDDVKVGLYDVAGATYADIYLKVGTYARTVVSQLEGNRSWTLVASNEVADTTTTDAKTSVESYATVEAAATKLHSQAYTSITSSVDGGNVANATKATQDASGNTITSTYMTKSNPTGSGYLSINRKSGTSVGSYSIAVGQDCEASGAGSFAEGGMTVASGRYSHAEGHQSKATATYAHAEGVNTTASNMYSHAEGNTTTASGMGCHAEGCETTASGINTHAEGLGTQATSNGDHAEGGYTKASGVFSHAEGYYTEAASSYQHVQGQYNIVDKNNTYLHIVGNGESETARSNAHTLDRGGNAWYAGKITSSGLSWDAFKSSHGIANEEAGFTAERTDTGTSVRFGVGAAGVNHGIYSDTQKRWLIHGNATDIYIGGYKAYGENLLYNNTSGNASTVTLSDTAANYTYFEIFYMDNNSREYQSVKIFAPNGKTTDLSVVEASSTTSTIIRRTRYTISGKTITPDITNAGYLQLYHNGNTPKTSFGTNYIRIVRVVGLL